MKLTLAEIALWTKAELRRAPQAPKAEAAGYSIDSRTLAPGELFFAVTGERFNAHDFVAAAMERGAAGAVIARAEAERVEAAVKDGPLLVVDDPLAALQELASAVRRHWGKRVIAVTGSAGKTTTKDAIAAVLASRFKVLKSKGNLNNAFGLPLQLLRLEAEDDVAVVEMGMSHPGEIAALARIAAPDWGVVTNVGSAHAEGFAEGIAGIARAKYELVASLPPQGVAFLNCDDPYVSQFGRDFAGRAVYFGTGPCADPRASAIEDAGLEGIAFDVEAGPRKARVHLALLGRHHAANAMAAIAVGLEAGIPLEECAAALRSLAPGDKRGEALRLRGANIINDCYNSNPEALKSMIAMLAAVPARRRILVAGEMLELGPGAKRMHQACGEAAAQAGIDVVIGVRGHAQELAEAARRPGVEALFVETPQQAGEWLNANLRAEDAVLLKASRGVRLEQALEALRGSR